MDDPTQKTFGIFAIYTASSYLIQALFTDMVQRGILSADAAEDVIGRAIEGIEAGGVGEQRSEVDVEAVDFLKSLLEHLFIKSKREGGS